MSTPQSSNTYAAIILFVYNRPQHTRQTVEALANNLLASESELWIFADAAKTASDQQSVQSVRDYIHSLPQTNQFADIHIIEARQNKGLAQSIIEGVTKVINLRKTVIVLEDDLITAPDFLTYMNACLQFFNHHENIGAITGFSPLKMLPNDYHEDIYSVARSCSLGWGTWHHIWQQIDWEVQNFSEFSKDIKARKRFNQCGSDRFDRLRRQIQSDIDSWSIRFGYGLFTRNLNTIYPAISRIQNIGCDGSGVHDKGVVRYNNQLAAAPSSFTLSNPQPNKQIIKAFHKIYSGGYLSRIVRFIRNI